MSNLNQRNIQALLANNTVSDNGNNVNGYNTNQQGIGHWFHNVLKTLDPRPSNNNNNYNNNFTQDNPIPNDTNEQYNSDLPLLNLNTPLNIKPLPITVSSAPLPIVSHNMLATTFSQLVCKYIEDHKLVFNYADHSVKLSLRAQYNNSDNFLIFNFTVRDALAERDIGSVDIPVLISIGTQDLTNPTFHFIPIQGSTVECVLSEALHELYNVTVTNLNPIVEENNNADVSVMLNDNNQMMAQILEAEIIEEIVLESAKSSQVVNMNNMIETQIPSEMIVTNIDAQPDAPVQAEFNSEFLATGRGFNIGQSIPPVVPILEEENEDETIMLVNIEEVKDDQQENTLLLADNVTNNALISTENEQVETKTEENSIVVISQTENEDQDTNIDDDAPVFYSKECLDDLIYQTVVYQAVLSCIVKLQIVNSNGTVTFTQFASEDILADAQEGLIRGGIFTNHFRPVFINRPADMSCLNNQYAAYNKELMKHEESSPFHQKLHAWMEKLKMAMEHMSSKSKMNNANNLNLAPIESLHLIFPIMDNVTSVSSTVLSSVSSYMSPVNLITLPITESSVFAFAGTWEYISSCDRFVLTNNKITNQEEDAFTRQYLKILLQKVQSNCQLVFKNNINIVNNNTLLVSLNNNA